MQRRKFIAGLGSLAAAGAAGIGTGAFTTGEFGGSAAIQVQTANGGAAIGISTKTGYPDTTGGRSPYANMNGPNLELDFTEGGSGLNNNGAKFTFDKVFEIQNNSTRTVQVGLDVSDLEDLNYLADVDVHVHSTNASLDDSLDFGDDPVSIENNRPNATLAPGESLTVDFKFETTTNSKTSDSPAITVGAVDANAP